MEYNCSFGRISKMGKKRVVFYIDFLDDDFFFC